MKTTFTYEPLTQQEQKQYNALYESYSNGGPVFNTDDYRAFRDTLEHSDPRLTTNYIRDTIGFRNGMDPTVSQSKNYLNNGKLGANPASSSSSSKSPAEAKYITAKNALEQAKNNIGYATDPMAEQQLRKELKKAQADYDAAEKEFAASKLQEANLITEEQAAGLEPVTPVDKGKLPDISNLNQLALQQGPQKVGEQELVPGRANQAGYRAVNTITGAVKGAGADVANAAGTVVRGMGESSASANPAVLRAQGLSTAEIKAELEKASSQNKGQRMVDTGTNIQESSDSLAQSSAEDIAQAKQGLNGLGKLAVDLGSNAIQMGGDALAAILTGGVVNPLTSMFVRSAGGAAREARQAGASTAQQIAYGTVRGGIEVATEKMFDGLAGLYGKGGADDIVESVIGKLAGSSDVGKTALRTLFSGVGEAIEEGVSGATEPLTQAIYKGIRSIPEGYNKEQASDVLYSMLVGFAMGGAGGAVNILNGSNAEANAKLNAAAAATEQNTNTRPGMPSEAWEQQNVNQNPLVPQNGRNYEGTGKKAQNPEKAAAQAAPQQVEQPAAQLQPAPIANGQSILGNIISEYTMDDNGNPATTKLIQSMTTEQLQAALDTESEDAYASKVKPLIQEELGRRQAESAPTAQPETNTPTRQISIRQENPDGTVTVTNTAGNIGKASDNYAHYQSDVDDIVEHFKNREQYGADKYGNIATVQYHGFELSVQQKSDGTYTAYAAREASVLQLNTEIGTFATAEEAAKAALDYAYENESLAEWNQWTNNKPQTAETPAESEPAAPAPEQPVSAPAPENPSTPETPQTSPEAPSEELNSQPASEAPETPQPGTSTRGAGTESSSAQSSEEPAGGTTGSSSGTGNAGPQTNNAGTENREGWVPPSPPQQPTGESTSDNYEELGKQYGTIPPGEKATRETNTPKRTAPGNKVSQGVRNVQEADATPESRLQDIQAAVADGKFSFVSVANESLAKTAEAEIEKDGWAKSLKDWTADVRAGKASAELVAKGAVLLNNAANNPDCSGAEYVDLMIDYINLSRAMGRGLQSLRILKTLSPEGRLYAFQRIVQDMNNARKSKMSARQQEKQTKKAEERKGKVEEAVKGAKEKAAKTVFTFEYTDEAAQMIAKAVESKANAKTQRSKTMMEELVDTIKKFAVERIPSKNPNATRRMTATDLLTELSNNEEFAREAYELAQHQVRQDTKGTKSAAAASQFSDTGMDLTNSNIVKRAVAESAVSTNENRTTILNQSALGIGENEIANSIAEDLIEKTGASEDIANSIREAALDYVQEVLGSETFETSEEADAAADERVEDLVKKAMNQIGEKFNSLAVSDDYTREAALQAVHDILTEQYGVNGQSATRIAESIVEKFDARLSEAIQEELKNRFGEKEAKTITERNIPDRLAEAVNLGAFTSEYAAQAINDVFGVEGQYTLDPALIEEYRQQTTDEGRDAVIEKMQQAIADQIPSTLADKFTAIRYQNMLGNLKTQVRNVTGNTGMMLVQKAKNTMRSIAETALSIATGGKYQKTYSTLAILNPKLVRTSFMDFYNNKDIRELTMGEKKWGSATQQYERGIQDKVNPWKYGDNKLTQALHIAGKQGPIFKLLELYSKATSWAMENGDLVFTTLNYTDGLAGYLKAHKINASQWSKLVAEADADPSSEAAKTVDAARAFAIKQAQEATFRDTNAISEFAQNFDRNWKAAGIITKGIAPFRKTPANVAVRMEEYSPLGLANTVIKAIQAAKGKENVTGADVIDSLAKTMTGTGLAYLGWCLAAAGKARTKSDDKEQEAFDKLRGLQDYSITINGTNYTFDWAVPAAASLFMGVEAYNLMIDGDITGDDMMHIMGNLTSPMLQMSMLSGLNDALNNISNFNDETDALPQFVLNSAWSYLTQGFTNTLAGQIEQANEDYRQTYYTEKDSKIPTSLQKGLAKAGNKTPGIDYNAADYIDAWGRKQKNADSKAERYFNALVNPSYTSKLDSKSTKVDAELQRLYNYGKDKEEFPSVLPQQTKRTTTVNGKRLTAEEYETYATKKGQESLRLVTNLINSKEYQSLSDEGKAEAISECYSYAKYLADEEISKGRKEESQNDKYYNLLTGVDKSGTAYDKTALNASNFVAYTAFKIGLDDAVKNGDYQAIDKYVTAYGKQNNNLKTVLGERNSTVRALSAWKDAGLDSKTYYDVQKELVKSQQKLDKSQKTGSAVELDALANVNLPEATKKRLIDSLPDYGSKTVKGVYDVLYSYGFNSKQINDFWNKSQDWVYKESGEAQSSQKAGTLQPLEAAYAIQQLPGLTQQQMTDIYNQLKEVAHNPYKINDWGNWTFSSEKNYLDSGRSYQEFGGTTSGTTFNVQPPKASQNYEALLQALGIG